MASLASFHRTLAPILEYTEAALYERQKALVRIGALPKATGRGWASGGATANPESVAWVLLAVLATDSLSEIDDRLSTLAHLPVLKRSRKRCLFTGKASLLAAMTEVIDKPELARRCTSISVMRRSHFLASIGWKNAEGLTTDTPFALSRLPLEWTIEIHATLNGSAILQIADALAELK